MLELKKKLLQSHFKEGSLVASNIRSYDNFIKAGLQSIIDELPDIEPTIIPHDIDELKIRFSNVRVSRPAITEADGSERVIYPQEARLRQMTYAANVSVDVATYINGVQRDVFTTTICKIPVMLKSAICHLRGLSGEELVQRGEDPCDPGGYFVMNGTERVLVQMEDLVPNRLFVDTASTGPSKYVGKMVSELGNYKIMHKIERMKDQLFYASFSRLQRVPLIVVIKALGLMKDEEITHFVCEHDHFDELFVNLFNFADIKTEDDALDYLAKKMKSTKPREIRIERMRDTLDKFCLPHLGIEKEDRIIKAYNLCKLMRKFLFVSKGLVQTDDKDHYTNKRLKLPGDLLADLFRTHLRSLIKDLLYNYQRIVKRGKFPSFKVIIRDKLLTDAMSSSMSTGNWVGGRKGVSQRLQRNNFQEVVSCLLRVVSPLSPSQEHFAARAVYPSHLGRLCPIESPDGTPIGLRKNLTILASVTDGLPEEKEVEAINMLRNLGLRAVQ